MIEGRSDAFVFGWHTEMYRQRDRIERAVERERPLESAPVNPTPQRSTRTREPLPHSLESLETNEERQKPAWQRPMRGQLARRR